MSRLTSILRVTSLFAAASLAMAAPTTWIVNGLTFADGGTGSGSFMYDPSTNTYSNINITTTAGSTFATGATYTATNPGATQGSTLLVAVPSGAINVGTRVLVLPFNSALTGAGGTVTVSTLGQETTCGNVGCTSAAAPARQITGGSVTTSNGSTPVPALSNIGMAILAMLLLGSSALTLRRRAA